MHGLAFILLNSFGPARLLQAVHAEPEAGFQTELASPKPARLCGRRALGWPVLGLRLFPF